jgi:acyl transferase domain-containing protein
MACRFPGAQHPAQLWELLVEKPDPIGEVPGDRWHKASLFDPNGATPEKLHHWLGGFLSGVHMFDWRAFGMIPREARQTDPQHRLLLELAWEALEDAGLPVRSLRGLRAGVFAGIQWNDFARLLARDWSRFDSYAAIGNDFAFAANRISYVFGLQGPSLAANCGCASSLAACHLACHSLWSGEIDLALVGGVELILAPESSLLVSAAGVTSKSGTCRTLDARGDGFVRAEGAGLVVLKPVSKLAAGDRVYALIRGTALNHNGHNEWISAASAEGQQRAIRDACNLAGVEPREMDYVELHAPGNARGDAVELGALLDVIEAYKRAQPVLVGSIKPNLGHLGSASGMASLIKVALGLHRGQVPPSIQPSELHPGLVGRRLQFSMPTEPDAWPRGPSSTLAGVTALSLGGANAHVVLSGFKDCSARPARTGRWLLLPLSAQSWQALARHAQSFMSLLKSQSAADDVCYTAAARRSHHSHRLAVIGRSPGELAENLELALAGLERREQPSRARVVWHFGDTIAPGVSHSDAYREQPAFRDVYRRWTKELSPALRRSPVGRCFVVQVAAAALWKAWGVPCDAIAEGACGEIVAGFTLAGQSRRRTLQLLAASAKRLPTSNAGTCQFRADGFVLEIGSMLDRRRLFHTLGQLYECGVDIDWSAVYRQGRVVSLPPYPWQREAMWPDGLDARQASTSPSPVEPSAGSVPPPGSGNPVRDCLCAAVARGCSTPLWQYVRERVAEALGEGEPLHPSEDHRPFCERGLDSLTGAALKVRIERELGISLSTSLLMQAGTVERMAAHLGEQLLLDVMMRSVSADSEGYEGAQEVLRL